jgi:Druantia protein DruA
MANAAAARAPTPGFSVPASRLQEFEPAELGALRPRFRRLLAKLDGQPQSAIRRLLIQEVADVERREGGIDQLAYQASLLILRDYVASGYYPIVNGGRCYLAPVFESPALDAEKRRAALTRLYRVARDRALIERGSLPWIRRAAEALPASEYNPEHVLALLSEGPPRIRLEPAVENDRLLDTRGLWRAVRATWSMGAEASAPGREVAFVAFDERAPGTPLGILQFRNVVPEIMPRDRWLGVVTGTSRAHGYARLLAEVAAGDARERIAATAEVLRRLREHVLLEGLPPTTPETANPAELGDFARQRRERFRELRRTGDATAHEQLTAIKRAETLADLTRGINATSVLLEADDALHVLKGDSDVRKDLDAGLKKLWHYHMGFVALELSVCGAAPPFGPLRVGKLMAGLAGCDSVVAAWGVERPLGQIASKVYEPDVRGAVPNPGPLVVFTSGLFPGHSAQYNRASSGIHRWQKIGDTTGFGSFHVAVDTVRALTAYNNEVDGYAHITRTFGEGSGPRFRAVGRALARLGVPDLRRHEVKRPLYALPLVLLCRS